MNEAEVREKLAESDIAGRGGVGSRLEQRRVDDPRERPIAVLDQAELVRDFAAGRAQQRSRGLRVARGEENAVARVVSSVRPETGYRHGRPEIMPRSRTNNGEDLEQMMRAGHFRRACVDNTTMHVASALEDMAHMSRDGIARANAYCCLLAPRMLVARQMQLA